MSRRRGGVASLAFGVIALVSTLTAAPAHGQAPDQTGWWFKLKTKSVPVTVVMPTVPDGGLYVQQGPDGSPSAFGAVRYRLPGAAGATLTLAAARGSTTTLGAPLQACSTTAEWVPPSPAPGYWEDAPPYGKKCTPGVVSSDGKFVAFLFGPAFVGADALDVAIVPKDGAAPFAIAFDKPAPDALVVKPAPVDSSNDTPSPTYAAPVTDDSAGPIAAPPFTVVPETRVISAPPPSLPRSIVQTALRIGGLGDPDRGERMASLAGASAIVIGWWLLSSRRSRMPRLVGSLVGGSAVDETGQAGAVTRAGGIGRFARTRGGTAKALR